MAPLNLGVLVSGAGTNLQALVDAIAQGKLSARVAVVVSNVAGIPALERARSAGLSTAVVPHGGYSTRQAFDARVLDVLRAHEVELVVLAGFTRILTDVLLEAFPWRIVNVHPALLPAFPGMHAQRQALDYGVQVTGCTVHFVDRGTDTGPIIAQTTVPVLPGDDEQALGRRILVEEHATLVRVVQWIVEGRVRTLAPEGGGRVRVYVDSRAAEAPSRARPQEPHG